MTGPASLDGFPGSARIWIFGAERPLAEPEAAALLAAVDGFLADWAAHGVPLRTARAWRYGRFLVVAADVGAAMPSGCSIDALVRLLADMETKLGARFLGNEAVWYRDREGGIRRAARPEFRALGRSGAVTPDTIVFDNSITELRQLRGGRWEGPARDRWHAALLR